MDTLRQKYNPDGSTLRKHQLRMLEMLCFIDDICKEHKINYWLNSGTLLGAVRHGGFIPWDDDLDIELLRPDYYRLCDILKKMENDKYILQVPDTDPDYYAPYAKLRDLRSELKEHDDKDKYYNLKGIFVDIFPLEPSPLFFSKLSASFQYRLLYHSVKIKNRFLRRSINKLSYLFLHRLVFPSMRLFSKLSDKDTLRYSFGCDFPYPRHTEDLFPLGEVNFEGRKFPAPNNTDSYLRKIYGDYMRLPDSDSIQTHTAEITIKK